MAHYHLSSIIHRHDLDERRAGRHYDAKCEVIPPPNRSEGNRLVRSTVEYQGYPRRRREHKPGHDDPGPGLNGHRLELRAPTATGVGGGIISGQDAHGTAAVRADLEVGVAPGALDRDLHDRW